MATEKREKMSFSSQLSENIWGHRFMDGQRGPEYVLEFLNVMSGTDYTLDAGDYRRRKLTGLRKFIFEGDKEGRTNEIARLDEEDRNKLYAAINDKEKIDVVREFFRNLEVPIYDGRGKPANRSWYAKSIYPLHDSLLFFEIRKKGENIAYERNFFARGGELYYLMLSNGTKSNDSLKKTIEARLKQLLSKNKPIESIVGSITNALDNDNNEERLAPLREIGKEKHPYLPQDVNILLFEKFAEEFGNLIKLNIDIYEMFKLLTSLTTFQIMRYLLERVSDENDVNMFFDCMDGRVEQVMKQSAISFNQNELLIKRKYENTFEQIFYEKIKDEQHVNENLEEWKKDDGKKFFELLDLGNLHKRTKQRAINVLKKCNNFNDINTKLFKVVKDIIDDQLKKHQIPIVRGLVRDGGMGGFRSGSNYRYFMSDNFLKVLVFINVTPLNPIEYSDFLNRIYENYGIVIGEVQAKQSGLYEKSQLNVSYFQKNEQSLREKLRQNGLLIEYSDATAMIRNPYEYAGDGVNL